MEAFVFDIPDLLTISEKDVGLEQRLRILNFDAPILSVMVMRTITYIYPDR